MTKTRDAYDRWAATYDTDPNPLTALEFPHVLAQVDPRMGERILDAACGTGRYLTAFANAGALPAGCDLSPGMLALARLKHPSLPLREADLSKALPYDSGSFDKVNCAQALKHLPDLRAPIRELARVLVAGGTLVVSVTHPDMDWDGYEMRETPCFVLSREAEIHHHLMTDYLEAFEAAGMAPVEIQSVKIDESIRHLLTEASLRKVFGRPHVAVFVARK